MEIYRNTPSPNLITFRLPAGVVGSVTAVDIIATEGGRDIYVFDTVTAIDGGFQAELPWHLTRMDRDLYIHWKITYNPGTGPVTVTERQYVQVVTPILPLEEIASIMEVTMTDSRAEVEDIERRVRYAIQSYTGQNFGMFYGVMPARGMGSNTLRLPAPLLQFAGMSFDGIYRPNYAIHVSTDGWSLLSGNVVIDNIKQAPPEWMLDRFDYVGKIYAPMIYSHHVFSERVEYKVEGTWGYNDVPGEVKQAARQLVQDYSCDESLWRERYISSILAADWRLQFDAQAFSGTGNAAVDMMLSGYRRQMMAVV